MEKQTVWYVILFVVLMRVACNPSPSNRPNQDHSQLEQSFALARQRMVELDLKGRDITDQKVLEVMGKVPRHRFVPPQYLSQAYADRPLPIGEGQTISQPYIVALMTQWLQVGEGDTVLEVGTGSGYQAAVLAEMVDQVYTIEIIEPLASRADTLLKTLGYTNIKVKAGDGYKGWEEYAPFDGIIVTAAAKYVPPPLIEQLWDGGRIVMPVGDPATYQQLELIEKKGDDITSRIITGVRFVPMTGEVEKKGE